MPNGDSKRCVLAKLLAGDIVAFDEALQEHMRGSAGEDMRLDHLLEHVAGRLFCGDFEKARRLAEIPNAALGMASIREAAKTHHGMLQAKELIATLEATGFSEGLLALSEAVHREWQQESDLLLDLLPAAWGMHDSEFERLLHAPPNWLRAWRNHEVSITLEIGRRLRRLQKLHDAFRMVVRPQGYAEAWRRIWRADSPIGHRSPWQAYNEDGEAALDTVEACFLGQR